MEPQKITSFQSLKEKVGPFSLRNKIFLIPEMNHSSCHLLAAVFRGFGIQARILETYQGMDLGKEYTSGKECFPCQITTGDILHFMRREQERLGEGFNAGNYIYFMPEADGPCRFGMYNKHQRIVLDSFPELEGVKIGSLTTKDSYALDGMIEKSSLKAFRKVSYLSVVVSDILDRLLWRIRPYEKENGITDTYMKSALRHMRNTFEACAADKDFEKILDTLDEIVETAAGLIDPTIGPKPRIGVVGEIYLRTHVHANQDLIRMLERYGAEVVNASISEWINYITYDSLRKAKSGFRMSLKQLRTSDVMRHLRAIFRFGGELLYQERRQQQVYRRAQQLLDLTADHRLAHLEQTLSREDLFSFDIGTEACLSIASILEYARDGFDGVVNVYPFTCMPSTITSAVIRPRIGQLQIPYVDTPYDGSIQPGRESTLRTFMYQARQHFHRRVSPPLGEPATG